MQTIFTKIFSVIWATGYGLGTIYFWVHADAMRGQNGEPASGVLKWVLLGTWILGFFMLYWLSFNLKRVRLSGRTLLISNYLKEIRVEGDEIAEVTSIKWLAHQPVTIHFRQRTEFGDRITFMPKIRWLNLGDIHPVVDELRQVSVGMGGA